MRKILFLLPLVFHFTFAQQAEVTNIQAAQRTDGSQIVDITYDITEDSVFYYFNVSRSEARRVGKECRSRLSPDH